MSDRFLIAYATTAGLEVTAEVTNLRIVPSPDPVEVPAPAAEPATTTATTFRPKGARREYFADLDTPLPDAHGTPIPVGCLVKQVKNGFISRVVRTYPRDGAAAVSVLAVGPLKPGQNPKPVDRNPADLVVLTEAEIKELGLEDEVA